MGYVVVQCYQAIYMYENISGRTDNPDPDVEQLVKITTE